MKKSNYRKTIRNQINITKLVKPDSGVLFRQETVVSKQQDKEFKRLIATWNSTVLRKHIKMNTNIMKASKKKFGLFRKTGLRSFVLSDVSIQNIDYNLLSGPISFDIFVKAIKKLDMILRDKRLSKTVQARWYRKQSISTLLYDERNQRSWLLEVYTMKLDSMQAANFLMSTNNTINELTKRFRRFGFICDESLLYPIATYIDSNQNVILLCGGMSVFIDNYLRLVQNERSTPSYRLFNKYVNSLLGAKR